jgi:hypothetical protein
MEKACREPSSASWHPRGSPCFAAPGSRNPRWRPVHGPHFHASHPDGSAKIHIDTLEVIDSNLGRRQLRFVLAWAELHQDELSENWRRARR